MMVQIRGFYGSNKILMILRGQWERGNLDMVIVERILSSVMVMMMRINT